MAPFHSTRARTGEDQSRTARKLTRVGSKESQELGRFQQRVDAIHKGVHPSGEG